MLFRVFFFFWFIQAFAFWLFLFVSVVPCFCFLICPSLCFCCVCYSSPEMVFKCCSCLFSTSPMSLHKLFYWIKTAFFHWRMMEFNWNCQIAFLPKCQIKGKLKRRGKLKGISCVGGGSFEITSQSYGHIERLSRGAAIFFRERIFFAFSNNLLIINLLTYFHHSFLCLLPIIYIHS